MARKTITVADDDEMIDVTPQMIEGVTADDVTKIRETDAALENDINAEMGGDENDVSYKISVFRIPDTGKDMPYLFSIPGENVAGIRERLMAEYGNGHYSIQVWTIRPRVGARIKAKYRVKIEMPKNAAPAPANNAGDAVAQAVLQQGKMLEALVTRLASSPPPPPPPAQDMAGMFAGMAAMAEAMRKIMGPPPVAAAPVNPLEMLSSVVTLVREANDEGREKGVMDLVGDFLKSDVLKSVLENMQPRAAPAPAQPRLAAPPQPGVAQTPNAPAPAPAPAAAAAIDPQEKALRDLLSILLAAAKKKSDVGLYADFIDDAVGAEPLAQLLALPDPVLILTQYEPEIANHREWFASVLNLLTEDGEGETTGGAPNPPAKAADAVGSPAPAPSPVGPA